MRERERERERGGGGGTQQNKQTSKQTNYNDYRAN